MAAENSHFPDIATVMEGHAFPHLQGQQYPQDMFQQQYGSAQGFPSYQSDMQDHREKNSPTGHKHHGYNPSYMSSSPYTPGAPDNQQLAQASPTTPAAPAQQGKNSATPVYGSTKEGLTNINSDRTTLAQQVPPTAQRVGNERGGTPVSNHSAHAGPAPLGDLHENQAQQQVPEHGGNDPGSAAATGVGSRSERFSDSGFEESSPHPGRSPWNRFNPGQIFSGGEPYLAPQMMQGGFLPYGRGYVPYPGASRNGGHLSVALEQNVPTIAYQQAFGPALPDPQNAFYEQYVSAQDQQPTYGVGFQLDGNGPPTTTHLQAASPAALQPTQGRGRRKDRLGEVSRNATGNKVATVPALAAPGAGFSVPPAQPQLHGQVPAHIPAPRPAQQKKKGQGKGELQEPQRDPVTGLFFSSYDDAEQRVTLRANWKAPADDHTIPRTDAAKQEWVRQLYAAFTNVKGVLDKPGAVLLSRWIQHDSNKQPIRDERGDYLPQYSYFNEAAIEKVCWDILVSILLPLIVGALC